MKCDVCGHEMREQSPKLHVREKSPWPHRCLGCWTAQTGLELFLIRGTGSEDGEELGPSVMGPWAEGWLREILKDPRRYL